MTATCQIPTPLTNWTRPIHNHIYCQGEQFYRSSYAIRQCSSLYVQFIDIVNLCWSKDSIQPVSFLLTIFIVGQHRHTCLFKPQTFKPHSLRYLPRVSPDCDTIASLSPCAISEATLTRCHQHNKQCEHTRTWRIMYNRTRPALSVNCVRDGLGCRWRGISTSRNWHPTTRTFRNDQFFALQATLSHLQWTLSTLSLVLPPNRKTPWAQRISKNMVQLVTVSVLSFDAPYEHSTCVPRVLPLFCELTTRFI